MRRVLICATLVAGLTAGVSRAGDVAPLYGPQPCRPCPPVVNPCPPLYPGSPYYPPGTVPTIPGMPPTTDPSVPPVTDPNAMGPQVADPTAQGTRGGGQPARSYANWDGDFSGVFYRRVVTTTTNVPTVVGFTQRVTGTQQTVTLDPTGAKVVTNTPIIVTEPIVVGTPITRSQVVQQVLAGRYQGVLITDNDGPRPVDRVYFGYNFLSDIGASLNPGVGQTDLQRQHVGFEKTFLDGNASFGMRLPFVQLYGAGLGTQDVGDLTMIGKYAVYNDVQTGDLFSVGFNLTAPTGGGGAILIDGQEAPHSWLFQPWAGFFKAYDRAYVMGTSNLVVPSLGRDLMFWGNSLGVGYWVHRSDGDRLLTGVIPMAEFHVRTPLNNRDPAGAIFLQDQVNLTTGVHFLTARGAISPAICVPLVGPRPWALEAMCFANWAF